MIFKNWFFLIMFYSNKYLTVILFKNALIKFCWWQLSDNFIDGRNISLVLSEPKKTKNFAKKLIFNNNFITNYKFLRVLHTRLKQNLIKKIFLLERSALQLHNYSITLKPFNFFNISQCSVYRNSLVGQSLQEQRCTV